MINSVINKLDQASLAAISTNLAPTQESGLKVYLFLLQISRCLIVFFYFLPWVTLYLILYV